MNINEPLKPCPFCGSEVFINKVPLWSQHSGITHGYVGCYEFDIRCPDPKCGCQIRLGENSTIYRDEEEARANAIKAWNRRAGDRLEESQKIRCPKCGSSDYIRDLANDYHVKDSLYKYKCINCNTYISEEEIDNEDFCR